MTDMLTLSAPLVFPNLQEFARTLRESDWRPFHPGVTAHWLYNEGNGGASAVPFVV